MYKYLILFGVLLFLAAPEAFPQTDFGVTADTSKQKATTGEISDSIHFEATKIWEEDIKGRGTSLTVTWIGMAVVFFALTALYLTFSGASLLIRKSIAGKHAKANPDKPATEKPAELTGEINAAIAMALHYYFSSNHDQENTILTINRVSRMYSPWSSKIYNLRHHPRNW